MSSLAVAKLFGVKGRVALVTGGTSGIGLMIAKVPITMSIWLGDVLKSLIEFKGLVSNGAKVYVTALPTDDIDGALAELKALAAESGGGAIG